MSNGCLEQIQQLQQQVDILLLDADLNITHLAELFAKLDPLLVEIISKKSDDAEYQKILIQYNDWLTKTLIITNSFKDITVSSMKKLNKGKKARDNYKQNT